MTENAKIDASVILPELIPANLFSGPCFGDMTPSESSQAADKTDLPSLLPFSAIESIPNDVNVTNTVRNRYSSLGLSMDVQKGNPLQASVRSSDLTSNAYVSNGEETEQMLVPICPTNDTAIPDSQLSIPSTNNLQLSSCHPDAQSMNGTPAALTESSPDVDRTIFDAKLRSPEPSASVQLFEDSVKDSALDPAVDNNTFALSVAMSQDSLLTMTCYDRDTHTGTGETFAVSEAAELSSSLPAGSAHVKDTNGCRERGFVSSFFLDGVRDIGFDAQVEPSSSPPSSSPPLFSSSPAPLPSSQTTAPDDDRLVPCASFLSGNPQSHDQAEKLNAVDMDQFDAPINEEVNHSLTEIHKPGGHPIEPVPTLHTKLSEEGSCEQNPLLPLSPLPSRPSNLPTNKVESERKRDSIEDEIRMKIGQDAVEQEASRTRTPVKPTLTHSTRTSQKTQHDKLRAPFRSPLMKKVHLGLSAVDLKKETKSETHIISAEPSISATGVEGANSNIPPLQTKKRNHTQRAASQFKSPLSATASSNLITSVRLTPTIQAMECKVQILRRAVKVKKENEAEILENLARKWIEAGREVAWEVWSLVKENDSGIATSWGSNKRGFQDSWGWDEGANAKRHKLDLGKSWGWDMSDDEQDKQANKDDGDCEKATEDTMGTMLRQLGIDPGTLGWCEIEGSFVDS